MGARGGNVQQQGQLQAEAASVDGPRSDNDSTIDDTGGTMKGTLATGTGAVSPAGDCAPITSART